MICGEGLPSFNDDDGTKPPSGRLFLIATLDVQLATGTHGLKLLPERFVDFLELRVLFSSPVARQLAGAAVVG